MSDELRPCPFCGASGAHIEHGYVDGYHGEEDRFQVECKGCDAVGPLRKYEYEAVEEWNEVSAARAEGVAAGLDAMRARAEAAEDRAAQAEAAGYRRAIDDACAVLDAQHDEIAGRGTEWAYDDGMLYALDVGEQAVRALAPVEPVSPADGLPGGAA